MSSRPLVSVVIPTYYRNELLQQAIRSVRSQTYDLIEIIVVDDSGDQHAKPVVDEYDDITYVGFDRNRGANVARTEGAKQSAGRYIQFLDDDDILYEEKITKQIELFKQQTELVAVYCGGKFDDGKIYLPDPEARGEVLRRALTFNLPACVTTTMLIDRDAFLETLPLPDSPGSDDVYLQIELARLGPFEFVEQHLVYKRDTRDSRGGSKGAVLGSQQVLTEYASLYDEFPPRVRQVAEAAVRYKEGHYYLSMKLWSPRAILSFFLAWFKYPGFNSRYWMALLASFFGRPGMNIGSNMKNVLYDYSRS